METGKRPFFAGAVRALVALWLCLVGLFLRFLGT